MDALLDACSVSYLFQAGQKGFIESATQVCRVHLAEDVLFELSKETTWGKGCEKLFGNLRERGLVDVHSLLLGSDEATLFNRLRSSRPRRVAAKDQGELASIALAVHRPNLVLVTEDHGAMRWALDQIPGFPCRVSRTAGWIRAVVERGVRATAVGLGAWASLVPGPLPEWWAGWVSGLPA